jgi:hypothetical protein
LSGILSFTVLANNHPVEVSNIAVAERRLCTTKNTGGAHVSILLEGLADSEAEAPKGDVIRDIYNH